MSVNANRNGSRRPYRSESAPRNGDTTALTATDTETAMNSHRFPSPLPSLSTRYSPMAREKTAYDQMVFAKSYRAQEPLAIGRRLRAVRPVGPAGAAGAFAGMDVADMGLLAIGADGQPPGWRDDRGRAALDSAARHAIPPARPPRGTRFGRAALDSAGRRGHCAGRSARTAVASDDDRTRLTTGHRRRLAAAAARERAPRDIPDAIVEPDWGGVRVVVALTRDEAALVRATARRSPVPTELLGGAASTRSARSTP